MYDVRKFPTNVEFNLYFNVYMEKKERIQNVNISSCEFEIKHL